MDKRFDKLEEKLDQISSDISEIKVTQGQQAIDLKYHIRRTDQIEDKLMPLVDAKLQLDGAFKVIGMTGSGMGLIFGAIKAIEVIIAWL